MYPDKDPPEKERTKAQRRRGAAAVSIMFIFWMNLNSIMLSKKSQSLKATYCRIPFI